MPTILCYGDSNTWGFDPSSISDPYSRRFAPEVRWTGVMARELGAAYRVIEEGLNGRTTVHDDPIMPHRNGLAYLPACLQSHRPLDLVILMLGTNDLKQVFNLPVGEIAAGAGLLARHILQSECGHAGRSPRLLLIGPAATGNMEHLPDLAEKFPGAAERSRRFPACYSALAESLGCAYLNAQDFVQPSLLDGLHWEATEHAALGIAIAKQVRSMLPVA